ncbi:MAG: ATP-binding cassette domain-containing protein, partial [Gammaproteobacteria bacterium]|nr:ATP-binding cassette domain-containing protein [Gammaproteobacteria bacterium]
MYLAARQIVADDDFTIGMLFAFMSSRQTFTDRSLALVNQAVQFSYLHLHLDRLGDIVHAERDASTALAEIASPARGGLAMRSLSFRYGTGEPLVLDNVDFEVPPGAFVAFTGPSGGGKSTLLKLMLGLETHRRGCRLFGWRKLLRQQFFGLFEKRLLVRPAQLRHACPILDNGL